ncbi:MAG: 16S rRNA (cytosine(1402)-N(4))-methyltransferase [Alistipes shahii]
MSQYHTPVLLEESVGLLAVEPAGAYADLTFGGGGHSRRILSALGPEGRLYGFDQDRDTLENRPDDARFHYVESNFRFLRGALRLRGVTEVDGILADLGVSSHHFDAVERGFSFRGEAPLDMRMNQRGRLTAADVVNDYTAEDLTRILGDWGTVEGCQLSGQGPCGGARDDHGAAGRSREPFTPKKDEAKFLTKLFQALRIEVNGEMEALKMALEQSLRVLNPGGRLVVISYHSLEDRLVKNFMRSGNFSGQVERTFSVVRRPRSTS